VNKICWIDVETTGLDPKTCCIVQLAALMEVNGEIKDECILLMKPDDSDYVSSTALRVHGLTMEKLATFQPQREGYRDLICMLESYVNKYNRNDKLIFAAYNAHFDDQFLRQFFLRNANSYYGSYFFWPKIDVQTFVAMEIAYNELKLENYKLETVCKHYGIELEAHDALSDIKATRDLYKLIREGSK